MEKAAFEAIKYITNPYALIAFVVLIVGYTFTKIRSGNRYKEDNSNNINVSGINNEVNDVDQSTNKRDDRDDD